VATFKEIVNDFYQAAQRGSMTPEEFLRYVGYLIAAPQEIRVTDPIISPQDVTVPQTAPMTAVATKRNREPRRQFLGRGEYGWVNMSRAWSLNSVALLELGRAADRQTRLSHIEKRWEQNFESSDLEILPAAAQPRWKKCANGTFTSCTKKGWPGALNEVSGN